MNSTINIAILAHVDAGKTTLTERLLFHAGELKNVGNVDKGTTVSDFMQVERERGISVVASNVGFQFKDIEFNIIDTPGHADFMSEVERSLIAVDLVVLLVSASDGVQAQTRVLWNILENLAIPRIILINKIDRVGIDIPNLIEELRNELNSSIIPVQNIEIIEDKQIVINSIFDKSSAFKEMFYETIAEFDDIILESFLLGDDISDIKSTDVYIRETRNGNITPALFSSAKNSLGIEELLDEILKVFKGDEHKNDKLSAVVYRLSHNHQLGMLTHLRLFSGTISKRDDVYNQRTEKTEKVNQIKKVFSNKLIDLEIAEGGQIVAIAGFSDAQVGDVIGEIQLERKFKFNTIPILTVEIKPVNDEQFTNLADALSLLFKEDPLLDFRWYKDEKQLHLKVNGWIQIQILESILYDRFGIEAKFETPTIIYKETPRKSAFGYEEYTMPKPCWAVIKLKVEPTLRGNGVEYISEIGVNDILLKYQKEVERTIPLALEQGIKGWEVTDLKITLVEGEDHVMHSRPGDFAIATQMAMMNALTESETELLEPIMKFELQAPESILGQIVSDIHKMRGEFEQPIFLEDKIKIIGKLPAATSMEYPITLASRSGGKAFIQMQFESYQQVELENGAVRDYRGVNPLDRAKFILKARKAIQ